MNLLIMERDHKLQTYFFEHSWSNSDEPISKELKNNLFELGVTLYKTGAQHEWHGADGHGGGEYYERQAPTYSELPEMFKNHKLSPEITADLQSQNESLSGEMLHYFAVYEQDGKSEVMMSNQYDNTACGSGQVKFLESFMNQLQKIGINSKMVENVQYLTTSQIKNDALLSKVNVNIILNEINKNISNKNSLIKEPSLKDIATVNNFQKIQLIKSNEFYNVYGKDAELLSSALGVKLFKSDQNEPAIGFPEKSLPKYAVLAAHSNILLAISDKEHTNQQSSNNTINLMRQGAFLNAYGQDAEKLAELLELKTFIKRPENIIGVGFPEKSLDKYKAILEENNINYEIEHKLSNNEVLDYYKTIAPDLINQIKSDKLIELNMSAGVEPKVLQLENRHNPEYICTPKELSKALEQLTGHKCDLIKEDLNQELTTQNTNQATR